MNSLHLFAGIGGGILADKILGHTIVGAVEIEAYCRAVLKQRQEEGLIEPFPLFDDVRTFKGDEIERPIDLVCGGFPCQDISCAGRGAGIKGKKSGLFYELVRICRTCRPKYVFLENSPAITGRGLGVVLNEIASLGYDAEWTTLSAGLCGAPHLRNRWWCLCKMSDSDSLGELQPKRVFDEIRRRLGDLGLREQFTGQSGREESSATSASGDYTDANGGGLEEPRRAGVFEEEVAGSGVVRSSDGTEGNGSDRASGRTRQVSDSEGAGLFFTGERIGTETKNAWTSNVRPCESDEDRDQSTSGEETRSFFTWPNSNANGVGRFTPTSGFGVADETRLSELADSCSGDRGGWWSIEPNVGRVANGIPNRVDRIKGLGNAQVPVVAALAFYMLMERFCE